MFVLNHGWRSSASRRVRLCLAEKGLQFESVLVDLTRMQHHSPEYLKLNPNGVIPLLILPDGRSLYESGTICEYLDETYPTPPLRPDDAYSRAEMRSPSHEVKDASSPLESADEGMPRILSRVCWTIWRSPLSTV